MKRRDVERLLRALGREQPPAPTESFVESLAARLRAIPPSRRPRPRLVLRTGLALAGAAIVAAVVAGVLVRPGDDSLLLSSASDATITFPDGSVATDLAATELPDGTVVRTGPNGRVEAGGEVLGPNSEARVRQGRLVVEPRTTAAPTRRTAAPTRPAPDRTPPPRPTATFDPARTPPPRDTPTPRPGMLELACREARGGILCRWSPTDHADFASYVLTRSDGRQRATVFRTEDRSRTSFTDERVTRRSIYTYVVEARDARGNVIASGGPVRAQAP